MAEEEVLGVVAAMRRGSREPSPAHRSGTGGGGGGGGSKRNNKRETTPKANWRKIFAARKFLSLAHIQAKASPAQLLLKNQYLVGKKLNNGAFGQVRLGRDLHHHNRNDGSDDGDNVDDLVAIKMEPTSAKIPMLALEFKFYRLLAAAKGLPKVYHYGPCGKYNALVMELLGPNLEELFVACGKKFSLQTILLIAIQLLNRIEFVHSNGIVYRDIKPENVCVGRPSRGRSNLLHLVDFGLAKEFLDPDSGEHIPYREERSLTGTVRYMSINAHQGREQSRRDDLEALGHMFFYFLTNGRLPWQGVRNDDTRKRCAIISRIKEETTISELGNRHPWEFSLYLRYCRCLKFAQNPDYSYLRNLFRNCLKIKCGSGDLRFDWEAPASEGSSMTVARVNSRSNFANVHDDGDEDETAERDMRPRANLDAALVICVDQSKSNESMVLTRSPSVRSSRSAVSNVTRVERSEFLGHKQQTAAPPVTGGGDTIEVAVDVHRQQDQPVILTPVVDATGATNAVSLRVPNIRTQQKGAVARPVAAVEPLPRQQQGSPDSQRRGAENLARELQRRSIRRKQMMQHQHAQQQQQDLGEVEVVTCKGCCYVGRINKGMLTRRISMKW